jgi:uncharacterized phage protein (TIGR01671 family)
MMVREIKFRVWDKTNKRMGLIINIDYFHELSGILLYRLFYYDLDEDVEDWANNCITGDEGILMQYTGLKDKNGKEIYEGDLMTHPDFKVKDVGSVTFLKGCFLLSGWDCVRTDFSKGEVIGNIYENPELL